MHKKTFSASLDHLYEMLSFVQEFASTQGFDPFVINKIILASEEALVNVIRYSYKGEETGELEIICENPSHKAGIKILIKDHGVPFDPTSKLEVIKEKHEKKQKIEDYPIGGYGILIYSGLMDEIEYRRIGEANLLFLIKYLSEK